MQKKRYPEPEIETALTLAATIGQRPAAAQLGIPQATLHNWTRDKPQRYAEIKAQLAPQWRERAAAETESIVESLAELEREAIAKLREDLTELEPKEAANALKAITVSKGINADHVAKYRGQPSQITEVNINLGALDSQLRDLGIIDATATEVEPGRLGPAAPEVA